MSATRSANIREVLRLSCPDDPDLLAREVALQVVRKTLRRSAYRIDIHTIGPHAHNPAQTARTELEVLVKTLYKFFHIVIHQVFNLFSFLHRVCRRAILLSPALVVLIR